MKIWLDDLREPPPGWAWCRTAESCIKLLEEQYIDQLSVDYDLQGGSGETGYSVLVWLENIVRKDSEFEPPDVIWIHSAKNTEWKMMSEVIKSIRKYEHNKK